MTTYTVTIYTSIDAESDLLARIKVLHLIEDVLEDFELEIEQDYFVSPIEILPEQE